MIPLDILIGCEVSGYVRDAFLRKGHNAISCDLLPSDSNLGEHWHIDQDTIFDTI